MSARVTQLSYNAGILSGLMEGRADDPKYQAGLAVCRNAMCTPQGPVRNRAGFVYVNSTKYAGKPVRLIPFSYSADQTMVIELGDKYARFHTQGKTLLRTGSERAVLAEGDAPYEIETPWAAEDLRTLRYAQNAEVMTITSPNYPPHEIRRHSLTDWRINECNFVAKLSAPNNVVAARATEAANDDNKDKYTQKYVVTALNKDRTEESEKSAVASVKANLFATGTTVEITWSEVPGAAFYRVYKLQGGIYGYLGETSERSITDDNIAPETGVTPPYQDEAFGTTEGITKVNVTNGGSGYVSYTNGVGYAGDFPKVKTKTETFLGITYQEYVSGAGVYATYASRSVSGSVPPFPTPDYATIRGWVDIIDYTGGGKGATVEVTEFLETHGISSHETQNSNWYTAITKCFIKEIRVVNPGDNYVRPVLRIKRREDFGEPVGMFCTNEWAFKDDDYAYFDLNRVTKGLTLNVIDATGVGAELRARVANGAIVGVDVVRAGRGYSNPSVAVVAEAGSGATFTCEVGKGKDNPAAVGFFEQRRVFAGSGIKPQRIWMSATGTDSNFTYHLPLQDDDRISFDIASRDLNQIQHVVSLQQLIMLTSAAEWRVSPLNSDAITPTSISVRPQSYVGASETQPILANNTAIYAAARGGHVREIAYNYTAGGYITGDLSLRANELFDRTQVIDLAYSKEPFPVVWAVTEDGRLLGLTYVPEQQVGAWFEFTTQGSFESVAVVQEGEDDALYAAVMRVLGGRRVRTIERMARRNSLTDRDGIFLDMAGVYSGGETTTLSGLMWLAGNSVTVNADGVVYEGVRVSDEGTLTLPKAAKQVSVGLPYSMEIQTMPVVMSANDGSLGKGHTKNINRVWLRVARSAAPEVGQDFNKMTQQKTRAKETPGTPPALIDGVIEVVPPGNWDSDSSVCVRMSKPLPFTLISHSAEVSVGG